MSRMGKPPRRMVSAGRNAANIQAKMKSHKAGIAALLGQIGQRTDAFGEGEKADWGHVGCLGHLRSLLVEANAFMAGYGDGVAEAEPEKARAGK